MIICSGAVSKWDMRDPRQLIATGNVLGLELNEAFDALSTTPLQLIQKNKKILEGQRIAEGVEILPEKGEQSG